MRKSLYSLTITGLIACTTFSFTPSALAGDDKVFSGNGCRSYYGNQESRLHHLARYTRNASSSTTWVSCPLVRDNTTNGNGTNQVLIRVYRDGTVSENIDLYCQLVSGNGYGSYHADSDSYLGHGNAQLVLDVNSSWWRGQYSVRCKLPRNARVYSVVLREH